MANIAKKRNAKVLGRLLIMKSLYVATTLY